MMMKVVFLLLNTLTSFRIKKNKKLHKITSGSLAHILLPVFLSKVIPEVLAFRIRKSPSMIGDPAIP